jgi:hypothetical protein
MKKDHEAIEKKTAEIEEGIRALDADIARVLDEFLPLADRAKTIQHTAMKLLELIIASPELMGQNYNKFDECIDNIYNARLWDETDHYTIDVWRKTWDLRWQYGLRMGDNGKLISRK